VTIRLDAATVGRAAALAATFPFLTGKLTAIYLAAVSAAVTTPIASVVATTFTSRFATAFVCATAAALFPETATQVKQPEPKRR
jgi:hypothetical protein